MKKQMMASVLFAAVSTANAAPGDDPRIRTVTYEPNQVVRIYTAIGNPTLIQFEDGETVEEGDSNKAMIGIGDKEAWKIGPRGSNVMLKPAASKPDTKLLIVTNKRTYAFEILSVPKKSSISPTLIVRFDYPDTRAKVATAASQKSAAAAERLAKAAGLSNVALKNNANYMMQGDTDLAPSSISDDGNFTFMRFGSSRALPVAYKVLPDGKEALTNFHMESDTGMMVVHETAAKFILRYGSSVLAIRNDGFNPDGKLNVSGTSLPNAVRLPRGEQ
jgi:type IV secretion system protein VirB9